MVYHEIKVLCEMNIYIIIINYYMISIATLRTTPERLDYINSLNNQNLNP